MLSELVSLRPLVVALQETKLPEIAPAKRKSFLPKRLSDLVTRPSDGTFGGILTAWVSSICTLSGSSELLYSVMTTFSLLADGSSFTLTNVYVPTLASEKPVFLAELDMLAASIFDP